VTPNIALDGRRQAALRLLACTPDRGCRASGATGEYGTSATKTMCCLLLRCRRYNYVARVTDLVRGPSTLVLRDDYGRSLLLDVTRSLSGVRLPTLSAIRSAGEE
jgi:hypothetical protein